MHGKFGSGISSKAREVAGKTTNRGDIKDMSGLLFTQVRQYFADHIQCAKYIHLEILPYFFIRQFFQAAYQTITGVVDYYIDSAKVCNGILDTFVNTFFI